MAPFDGIQDYYNLREVYLYLDGRRIEGFGDDDAIAYDFGSDPYTSTVSVDGRPGLNKTNDNRVFCDITVRENSPACRILGQLLAEQNASPVVNGFTFYMSDDINGDEIEDSNAAFISQPGLNKSQEAQSRVFRLVLPNARDNIRYAGQAGLASLIPSLPGVG